VLASHRYVLNMDIDRSRRLAFDLAVANLDDPEALTALLMAHVVAPARALFGDRYPRPHRDETEDLRTPRRIALEDGTSFVDPEDSEPEATTVSFDPFIRGWVLFHRLFPRVAGEGYVNLDRPEKVYFGDARLNARILWPEMAFGVGGMYERERSGEGDPGLRELRHLQALLRQALTPPEEAWWHVRHSMGLRIVDQEAAAELDVVLRGEVRQRLVWHEGGTWGLSVQRDGKWVDTVFDRGVFATVIPETIAGVVVLDFVETLRREPTIAPCAECGLWVEMSPQQVARSQAGKAIYHPGCHDQHRVRYVRAYQHGRRLEAKARSRTAAAATSQTQQSGD
jgi:hypothetical protein